MTPQNNWEETFEKEWTGEHYFGEPGDETWPSKIELKDFIRSVEEKAREEESLKWGDRVRQLEGKIKNLRAEQELLSSVDKSLIQSLNK